MCPQCHTTSNHLAVPAGFDPTKFKLRDPWQYIKYAFRSKDIDPEEAEDIFHRRGVAWSKLYMVKHISHMVRNLTSAKADQWRVHISVLFIGLFVAWEVDGEIPDINTPLFAKGTKHATAQAKHKKNSHLQSILFPPTQSAQMKLYEDAYSLQGGEIESTMMRRWWKWFIVHNLITMLQSLPEHTPEDKDSIKLLQTCLKGTQTWIANKLDDLEVISIDSLSHQLILVPITVQGFKYWVTVAYNHKLASFDVCFKTGPTFKLVVLPPSTIVLVLVLVLLFIIAIILISSILTGCCIISAILVLRVVIITKVHHLVFLKIFVLNYKQWFIIVRIILKPMNGNHSSRDLDGMSSRRSVLWDGYLAGTVQIEMPILDLAYCHFIIVFLLSHIPWPFYCCKEIWSEYISILALVVVPEFAIREGIHVGNLLRIIDCHCMEECPPCHYLIVLSQNFFTIFSAFFEPSSGVIVLFLRSFRTLLVIVLKGCEFVLTDKKLILNV
ncbi:hypothetical protein SERLA73DRAFT_156366 [Serpula lacrymans var. lacrymans S7.3]|uniref:Uncharacterized protein n=1 Tax=Serpula lacrymans var. lacrymans (strain S7.3) TaxID=936435 RepID=F8QE61_SERL3|nr:hypothetical protein SERLA73DRAFT_156366 [Serpula lacrymans var. lacrymans S7.3]